MSITLTKGIDSIALPPDLIWEDELRWSPVSQAKERSITGAWLIDVQARDGGRPITLTGRENTAWLRRADALTLIVWLALPEQVFTLTRDGVDLQVMFDHGTDETSNALQVTPVVEYSDPEPGDYLCNFVLRFFEV